MALNAAASGHNLVMTERRAAVYSPHNENSHIHLVSHTYEFRIEVEIAEIISVFIPLKRARQVL